MREQELVEYFERRRGDTSTWGKPVKAAVSKGGSVVFSLRLAPEELEHLRQIADEQGRSVSDLIRSAALTAAADPDSSPSLTMTIWKILTAMPDSPVSDFVDAGLGTQNTGSTKTPESPPTSVAGIPA